MAKRSKSDDLTVPDLVVLSRLTEQPMHGYQLNLELERHDVRDWAGISRPQVYYSLKKLAAAKLIKPVNEQETSGGPERQAFTSTRAGREALSAALARREWAEQRPAPPFITWLALSAHAEARTLKEMVAARREFLRAELARERDTIKELNRARGPMVKTAELMVELTIKQFQLELSWLDKVERSLVKKR